MRVVEPLKPSPRPEDSFHTASSSYRKAPSYTTSLAVKRWAEDVVECGSRVPAQSKDDPMSDSPDLIITAQNPRTDEIAFIEFERAEAFALARLVRSLTLGDCRW